MREREIVLERTPKGTEPGQTFSVKGAKHDGIFPHRERPHPRFSHIPAKDVRSRSPIGTRGNFVGGPEIVGNGIHQWSGMATSNSSIVQLPGKELRDAGR